MMENSNMRVKRVKRKIYACIPTIKTKQNQEQNWERYRAKQDGVTEPHPQVIGETSAITKPSS